MSACTTWRDLREDDDGGSASYELLLDEKKV
jgi:hypothetical protein